MRSGVWSQALACAGFLWSGSVAFAQSDPAAPAAGPVSLLDVSFDIVGAGGTSSAAEPDLRALQAGGHDPKNRGFTLQGAELTLAGVVDPYLRGDASIALQIDEHGESVVELEEAYLTSLDLPAGLQIKAGQFLADFGRLNATHPHAWSFVDQPVVSSRLLGPEGFRNPGVQLAWLTPLPFFTELAFEVHDAQGEAAPSFRGEPGASVAGRTLIDRGVRGFGDLAYLARLRTSFDVGDALSLVFGGSGLWGPNATARDTESAIYGADLYVKWKPLENDHGWPYVAWQSEGMYRRYVAAEVTSAGTRVDARRTLGDYGAYTQLLWGFARPWDVGARYDYARGEKLAFDGAGVSYDSETDPARDLRQRITGVVTFYPSEFSKLRLQYAYDRAQFLPRSDAHSVYLQAEILFGVHGAHRF